MRTRRNFIHLLLSLFALAGCVSDPAVDPGPDDNLFNPDVLILCEGLWNGDNAVLTAIDLPSGESRTDWFAASNPGLRLGDMANDMVIVDTTVVIAVSGSDYLEFMSLRTGRHLRRAELPAGSFPVSLAVADGNELWVATLNDDQLLQVDFQSGSIVRPVTVGPAPEGLAASGGHVFVANSGLGALRAEEEGAGELWVIDSESGSVSRRIPIGPNPGEVFVDSDRGLIWIESRTIAPDTTGGDLVVLDLSTLEVIDRHPLPGLRAITHDANSGTLLALANGGIYRATLLADEISTTLALSAAGTTLTEEVIHELAIEPGGQSFWLGIATGYFQGSGRVVRYRIDGIEMAEFRVGINPTRLLFPND